MRQFTTGQVAKMCKVSPRQAGKWFDSGRLQGYRIPGSQDRRIPEESLRTFIEENGMPMPQELMTQDERVESDHDWASSQMTIGEEQDFGA